MASVFFFRRILETAWNCTQWDGWLLEQDSQESIQHKFLCQGWILECPRANHKASHVTVFRANRTLTSWTTVLRLIECDVVPKAAKVDLDERSRQSYNAFNVFVATLPNVSVGGRLSMLSCFLAPTDQKSNASENHQADRGVVGFGGLDDSAISNILARPNERNVWVWARTPYHPWYSSAKHVATRSLLGCQNINQR